MEVVLTSGVSDCSGACPAASGESCGAVGRPVTEQAAEVALSSHCSTAAEQGWEPSRRKVPQEEREGWFLLL